MVSAALSGCGGSLTAGGFAEVDVAVSGDAPGGGASAISPRPRAALQGLPDGGALHPGPTPWGPVAVVSDGITRRLGAALRGPTAGVSPGAQAASPGFTVTLPPHPRPEPDAPPAGSTSVSTPPTLRDDDDAPEGEIELEFRLYLVRADGSEEPLAPTDLEVEVDLSGQLEVDAVRSSVPADSYTGLRIVFTEIEVEIDRGVIIDGVPVLGRIDVELEDDQRLEVLRPLDLRLEDGDRVELLVDINAGVWLQAIDPELRNVAEQVFGQAITVVVR